MHIMIRADDHLSQSQLVAGVCFSSKTLIFRKFGLITQKNLNMLPSGVFKKYCLLIIFGFLLFGNLRAQKLLDSIVSYHYQSDSDSVNGVKITYEYNNLYQKISHSIYLWNKNIQKWDGWLFPAEECVVCPGRYEYVYNDMGNLIMTSGFVWGGQSLNWLERTRTENDYDENGNSTSSIFSSWSTTENSWIPEVWQEFGYDDDGHVISIVSKVWYPPVSNWHPIEKKNFVFDHTGKKTQELRQKWVDSISDWCNQNKTEWYYDSIGLKTEIAAFNWVLVNNNFDWKEGNRHKIEYVYDSVGNRILTTDFVKSSPTRWTATYKEELKYNENGKPVLSVMSQGTNGLTEYLRTEWVYNPDNQLTMEKQTGSLVRWEGPLPLKERLKVNRSFDSEGDITHEDWYYWDGESQSYLSDGKDYYFYQGTSTVETESKENPIRIYPNPTTGILKLSGVVQPSDVKIYSIQGILIRSILSVGDTVDLSELSPGVYLIQIFDDNHTPFRSILIKE
jgi:hypothetical protein